MISTGLPYLVVPVASGLDRARIVRSDFEALLETVGAKFVYVLDVHAREGRTWDNDGRVEDIATRRRRLGANKLSTYARRRRLGRANYLRTSGADASGRANYPRAPGADALGKISKRLRGT